MAKRSYDFSANQKEIVKAYYGHICAACGCSDKRIMQVDHWIAGDSQDDGVCLCPFCNNVKADKYVFEKFRLPPKAALNVITHSEYEYQVEANRIAFEAWLQQFRFVKPGGKYRIEKFKNYQAPF